MRQVIGPAAVAAWLLVAVAAPDARAQVPFSAPAPGAVGARPGGGVVSDGAGFRPVMQPLPYAYAELMLPPSDTHPWAIVPGYNSPTYPTWRPGIGHRTSPYGDYGRSNYWSTFPFTAIRRPSFWCQEGHGRAQE